MIRMTLVLCVGLFVAMLIGGADRGQQRFGLVELPKSTAVVRAATVVMDQEQPDLTAEVAAFSPEAPLIALPATQVAAANLGVKAIGSKSANVRSGPGKDFDVVSKLSRGESVTLVSQAEGADGWSLIRIEGDGVEGYVANKLFAE
jgi:uncharacterized protein YgiM (DUF1202 family)